MKNWIKQHLLSSFNGAAIFTGWLEVVEAADVVLTVSEDVCWDITLN